MLPIGRTRLKSLSVANSTPATCGMIRTAPWRMTGQWDLGSSINLYFRAVASSAPLIGVKEKAIYLVNQQFMWPSTTRFAHGLSRTAGACTELAQPVCVYLGWVHAFQQSRLLENCFFAACLAGA